MKEENCGRRRFLAVLIPRWTTDRLRRRPSLDGVAAPLVVSERVQNALRILALDAGAEAMGLFQGQALTDARAMCPGLVAVEARPQEDARDFERLCERFMRYSPRVALYRIGAAFIDITGCEKVFGGEGEIIADIKGRLTHAGFAASLAVAPTPGAAYALASCGWEGTISPAEIKPALAPLPIEALRIGGAALENLKRLGLKRIGQIYDMPRAPLTARFSRELLLRLGQALGCEAETLTFVRPAPHYYADMRFAEPVATLDAVAGCVKALSDEIGENLSKAGKGARRFELSLFRVDNDVSRVCVRTSGAAKSPAHIARLFANRLDDLKSDIDAGFGFELLRLEAFETQSVHAVQHAAFDRAIADAAVSELKDRLSNRLGARRVCRLEVRDSHLPECADALIPATAPEAAAAAADPSLRRPVRILPHPEEIEALAQAPDDPPVRFRWRRVSYRIIKANGPERIADEWRRRETTKLTRDYYRVEDEEGRRYWIYREGLYERETDAPKWFLHGFFA